MIFKPVVYFFIASFSRFFARINIIKHHDVVILSNPDKVPYERSIKLKLELNRKGISAKVVFLSRFKFMYIVMLGKPGLFLNNENIKEDAKISFGKGLESFKPKVVVHFRDSWDISKYIRKYSNAKLVNIAHGVTGLSSYFKVIDFDYYLLYGDSSIINLRKNQYLLPGSTEIIKTGPVFSEFEYNNKLKINRLVKREYTKKIVYSSSYTGDKEMQRTIEISHKIVIDYAIENTDTVVLILLHPLEKKSYFWMKYEKIINLEVIESNISKNNIAEFCDIHVTMLSNSMIDFALRGLNTIIIRMNDDTEEYLFGSKYFIVVRNSDELKNAIDNNSYNSSKIESFLKYHCEYTDFESLNRVVGILEKITKNEVINGIKFP